MASARGKNRFLGTTAGRVAAISTSRQSSYVSSLSYRYGRLNHFCPWADVAATHLEATRDERATQRLSGHLIETQTVIRTISSCGVH